MSGIVINWAICKSALYYRQINNASAPPLSFLQVRCPLCRPTNSVKALKAQKITHKMAIKTTPIPVAAELDPDHISVEARPTLGTVRAEVWVEWGSWQALDVIGNRTQVTPSQLVTYKHKTAIRTSHFSTSSQQPHRCCPLVNNVENINRKRVCTCPSIWGNLGPNMTTWVSHCSLQCLRLTAWCFIALRTTAAYTGYEYTLTHPFNSFLSRNTQVSR